jgi:flagellar M-ring protein FliF
VLIDNVRSTGADGKTTSKPLAAQELEHVTQLVKDAVGFNAERGDSVNVVNSAFHEPDAVPEGELTSVPMWEQPFVRDMAKLAIGAIVLLIIIFTVLRPLTKGLLSQGRLAAAGAGGASPEVMPAGAAATSGRGVNGPGGQPAPLAYEQQLAQAKTLVGQDPKRVAQVVRTWVAQDE